MRKIILGTIFSVVVLVSCGKSNEISEEIEIVQAESVKIPYTESYIHHTEEDNYVVTDRDGRIQKHCSVESSCGETESVIREDSSCVRRENESDTDESSNGSESVSELVVTGEYNAISERGTEEYSTGDSRDDDDISPVSESGLIYLGDWTITAYCPCEVCCGQWATGYTASGNPAISGHTIACNSLPFYSKVMIDGIEYTVEDTGSTEYGDAWIDIFFDTHEEALAYGVQTREVYLVE